MARFLLPAGLLALMMGAAAMLPVVLFQMAGGGRTGTVMAVIAVGGGVMACGLAAVIAAIWRRESGGMPSGVRAAAAANAIFLAFCALELSDRLVRQEGKIFYWTTILFVPALALFVGLLAKWPWAWWVSRTVAALAVVWFLGFLLIIPFAPLQAEGVPIPWYGRLYTALVTIAFAGVFAGAFWSLGRSEVRLYFGRVGAAAAANERNRSAQR